MNIPIEPEALKTIVSGAILGMLTGDKRDELITNAIKDLFAPSTNSWERGTTSIQRVFNEALEEVARKMAEEMLTKDDTVKEKIRDILNEALVRVFETNREKTLQNLAGAITQGLAYKER